MKGHREWKWFKHGWQFDVKCKAVSARGSLIFNTVTVFIETKDKQDARREAITELTKSGYSQVEAHKVIPRW